MPLEEEEFSSLNARGGKDSTLLLRPWRFSTSSFFSKTRKLQEKLASSYVNSTPRDQMGLSTSDSTSLTQKQNKIRLRFRHWNPGKRKRYPVTTRLQCRSLDVSETDSSSNFGSSSYGFGDSIASGEFKHNPRLSSFADDVQTLSSTSTDLDGPYSQADFLSDLSRNHLYNQGDVNPLDMYFRSRHKQAMVRLCALLWIMKLEEDRLQRRQREGGHHPNQHCSSQSNSAPDGNISTSTSRVLNLVTMETESNSTTNRQCSGSCSCQLFDKISSRSPSPTRRPSSDAVQRAGEILRLLSTRASCSQCSEIAELRKLLMSPNLKALLQSHDVVAHKIYDQVPPSLHRPSQHSPLVTHHPFVNDSSSSMTSRVVRGRSSTKTSHPAELPAHKEAAPDARLVHFQKISEEPLGITLKVNEEGRCLVARIMHGGMIHRQGVLHIGDEILEINAVSVQNQSVDTLQTLLKTLKGSVEFKIRSSATTEIGGNSSPKERDTRGGISLKIVPSPRVYAPQCEIYVKALFNYDPKEDELIPCSQAGVSFRVGDVLRIINKDDSDWWQAKHWKSKTSEPAGLIPSPELQEWRAARAAAEEAKQERAADCSWFSRRKRDKWLSGWQGLVQEQLELAPYQEVVRLPQFPRKTLVLLGAHGVGRRHIKNSLIARHPDKFAYPIPHTTRARPQSPEAEPHYLFVSHETMQRDIANSEYLEYGSHEQALYGTKLSTVRDIHSRGLMAVLDVEPQALKLIRTAAFSPIIVFIAAPSLATLQTEPSRQEPGLLKLVAESRQLERRFGHLFDLSIVNDNIDDTIRALERAVEEICTTPQWVPVSWVY